MSLATLGEVAIYVAVTLVLVWPVSAHLATWTIGSGDTETYVWMNWRVAESLRSLNPFPTELSDGVHPYGSSLLTSDGYLPIYLGGLWNLVLAPVTALNMAVLTASMLNLWSARVLARRFSARRTVWIVTAIAFASAPAIAIRFNGHYPFAFAFTAPLILAWSIDGTRGAPVRPLRLGVLLYIAYLCSIFYLLFGALTYVITLLLTRPRDWRHLAPRVGVALGITTLLMSPFLVARAQLDREERAAGGTQVLAAESIPFSADVTSIALQPITSKFAVPGLNDARLALGPNVLEATIFPGFLLLLGLGSLVLFRSRARTGLLVSALLLWLVALGPSLRAYGAVIVADANGEAVRYLPFAMLQTLPGLGMIRTPNRSSFMLAAVLACGLAIALDWYLGQLRSRTATASVLVVGAAILATNLVIPVNHATMETDAAIRTGLRALNDRARPGDSMIFVPADCFDDLNNNVKLNVYANLPVVGCHANFASIPWFSGIERYTGSRGFAGLRCVPQLLGRRPLAYPADARIDTELMADLRRDLGVRFYVVDRSMAADARCGDRLQQIIEIVADNTTVVASNDRWTILDADTTSR